MLIFKLTTLSINLIECIKETIALQKALYYMDLNALHFKYII